MVDVYLVRYFPPSDEVHHWALYLKRGRRRCIYEAAWRGWGFEYRETPRKVPRHARSFVDQTYLFQINSFRQMEDVAPDVEFRNDLTCQKWVMDVIRGLEEGGVISVYQLDETMDILYEVYGE